MNSKQSLKTPHRTGPSRGLGTGALWRSLVFQSSAGLKVTGLVGLVTLEWWDPQAEGPERTRADRSWRGAEQEAPECTCPPGAEGRKQTEVAGKPAEGEEVPSAEGQRGAAQHHHDHLGAQRKASPGAQAQGEPGGTEREGGGRPPAELGRGR